MQKYLGDARMTNVSRFILRQNPCLERIRLVKKLEAIVHCDYVSIGVDQFSGKFLKSNLGRYRVFNRGFDTGARFIFRDCPDITLWSGPRFPTKFKFFIHVNLWNFNSDIEFLDFMNCFTGTTFAESLHRITRLDLAITAPIEVINPILIQQCGFFKWKRESSTYENKFTNYNNGHISGVRTNIRSLNISAYDRQSGGKKTPEGEEFRFEFQIRGHTLDSLEIRTWESIIHLDPFRVASKVEFYDPSLTRARSVEELTRFTSFQEDVVTFGVHHARKRHNKNRNFNRDFGRLLVPLTINNGKARLSYCIGKRLGEWQKKWFTKYTDCIRQ